MSPKIDYSEIAKEINVNFGLEIFQNLLGIVHLTNNKKVRLFDSSTTNNDTFYLKSKGGFCTVYNFSDAITYTPITAYAKAHNLSNFDALKELQTKCLNGGTVQRNAYIAPTNTPAKANTLNVQTNPLQVNKADILKSFELKHQSNLVSFLRKVFDNELVLQVLANYPFGYAIKVDAKDAKFDFDTVFWYTDKDNNCINGKYFAYDNLVGKRSKTITPNWYHYFKRKDKPAIGFYGEHLLKEKIWIVESEKTAIIVAIYLVLNEITDTVVWACGGLGRLKSAFENCTQNLEGKEITLFCDTDTLNSAYNAWWKVATELNKEGFDMKVSNLLKNNATEYQRKEKFDIADYFIAEFLKDNAPAKALDTKAYKYYLDVDVAPILQELVPNETVTPATEIPATVTPGTPATTETTETNEVTELSYQSYESLFKCFNEGFNFGAKVNVIIYETKTFYKNELEIFFNKFDFGRSVDFEIYEVFDVAKELQKVNNIINPQKLH